MFCCSNDRLTCSTSGLINVFAIIAHKLNNKDFRESTFWEATVHLLSWCASGVRQYYWQLDYFSVIHLGVCFILFLLGGYPFSYSVLLHQLSFIPSHRKCTTFQLILNLVVSVKCLKSALQSLILFISRRHWTLSALMKSAIKSFFFLCVCESDSMSFCEVPWGVRGGPVVSHHRRSIPFTSSPSSFSIRRDPSPSFQCSWHPCCLLTHNSLPAWGFQAWWPFLFLIWRLWKGRWFWENT